MSAVTLRENKQVAEIYLSRQYWVLISVNVTQIANYCNEITNLVTQYQLLPNNCIAFYLNP